MSFGRSKLSNWQGEDGVSPLAFSDLRISGEEAEDVQTATVFALLLPKQGPSASLAGSVVSQWTWTWETFLSAS